jgi:predicted esterase
MFSSKQFKILYIHGYRMNQQVMEYQSRKIVEYLPNCQHFFIDGTYKSEGKPPKIIYDNFSSPFYEYCQFEYKNDSIEYNGINKTIERLKKIVLDKNIDGIVGFSQGTYITSILCHHIPVKFVVSICGMKCMDDSYKINTDIPSFHIVGKKDEWYEKGKEFRKLYKDSIYIEHKGGHTFPYENNIYEKLAEWINEM